jgi:NADH dehydrogenase/NADH:ubiquinone oxidoreductase subunit G
MKITIDQREINVDPGTTILEAARQNGIDIPTLCYNEAFGGQGMCRMCMVEIKEAGRSRMVASCTYPIYNTIEVLTSTPLLDKIRRNIVALLYRRAGGSGLMQRLYRDYGCVDSRLSLNPDERCIMCRLCVKACEVMGSSAIAAVFRGTDKRIATPFDEAADVCLGCMACVQVCPTAAINVSEVDDQRIIWNKTFRLIKCERCGRPFATPEQMEYIRARSGIGDLKIYVRIAAPGICWPK